MFSALWRGRGRSRRQGGGGFGFLLKIPGRGGASQQRGGGAGLRGWEAVCGEFGVGGLIFFFFGAEMPTKFGMKCSIESVFFFQSKPLSGRRDQGLGLKFSSENEKLKPRMKILGVQTPVGFFSTQFLRKELVFNQKWCSQGFQLLGAPLGRNKIGEALLT